MKNLLSKIKNVKSTIVTKANALLEMRLLSLKVLIKYVLPILFIVFCIATEKIVINLPLPKMESVTTIEKIGEKTTEEAPLNISADIDAYLENVNESPVQAVKTSVNDHGINDKEFVKGTRSSLEIRKSFMSRFSHICITEMNKYGIPASITMAQAIIESRSGQSRLAREYNNFFGVKCFSKKCEKGHCVNSFDDHHKDFFLTHESAWESFRQHSKILQKDRYKELYKLDRTDYKAWAQGLQDAGYATSKTYAKKLIKLIEQHQLHELDK